MISKYNYVFLLALLTACSSTKKINSALIDSAGNISLTDLKYTVEEAPDWSAMFKRTHGWYGGDGIFAIPLDGKENDDVDFKTKNLILFSDSMVGGEIENGKRTDSGKMVHNSVAVFEGSIPDSNMITFYTATGKDGEPETVFIPNTPSSTTDDYYWLGDGFVNTAKNNTIYLFAYKMRNLNAADDWSFVNTKTVLIALPYYSKPPYKDQVQLETPLRFPDTSGTFGAGIFVNTRAAQVPNADGFIYVYGLRGKAKNLVVARVFPDDIENFGKWTFWNGNNWTTDMSQCINLTSGVSDELSVSPLPDGRYALICMQDGMSGNIGMRIGASPVGPFGPFKTLYTCKEGKDNKNYITYNAKAHPSLSKKGELLISYNVNAFSFKEEIDKNPNLYRPRFIKLKFQ